MPQCDAILKRFFEHKRWESAIDKGVDKHINKALCCALSKPEVRIALYRAIADGRYKIAPPHAALIPKDLHGNMRTVYANSGADRVLLGIANDLFFELTPDLVHPTCKSYIRGEGYSRVVCEASKHVQQMSGTAGPIGWKADLKKYFDSVPLMLIDATFDVLEKRFGKSALVTMIRDYYHDDVYIDKQGQPAHKYMSLRQGCAVSAWLSDVLLHDVDELMAAKAAGCGGYYVRYCDDMLFIGSDHSDALEVLRRELAKKGLQLNDDKTIYLQADRWFEFLGFALKGDRVSLSSGRIKKFQQTAERIVRKAKSAESALRRVNSWLYKGNGEHSWATLVLPVVNCKADLDTLNAYVMDCIRAAKTGKRRIGGLGWARNGSDGCIVRGRGRHVAANWSNMPRIDGYMTIGCMHRALKASRAAYEAIVRLM